MCIKRESKIHKKYIYPDWEEENLISYRYIEKAGSILYIGPEDTITIVCPDGTIHTEITPGYIKVYQDSVHVIWVRKALHSIKIGVPKESTSKGIGFHATIALQLTDPEIVTTLGSKKLTYRDIKITLTEIARTAFESIEETALANPKELVRQFNRRINELLINTELKAFTAVTVTFGTSLMCVREGEKE